jgi:nucleotidyltransferase substrate binding protein (TIGR01987 family)
LKKILNQIKVTILNTCPNVKRIYLFGSRANNEANEKSDIDIAVEGECNILKLKEEIEKIPTLLKIDIIHLDKVEERVKNRILQTSKILFSANKFLRFEDSLYNFEKAYKKFEKILNEKEFFITANMEEEFREIAIKRFEYTYENAWRSLKRYLEYLGFSVKSPRETFKEAYKLDLIDNEEAVLGMIEDRNYTSHVYDDFMAKDIENRLNEYKKEFEKILLKLKEKSETL